MIKIPSLINKRNRVNFLIIKGDIVYVFPYSSQNYDNFFKELSKTLLYQLL